MLLNVAKNPVSQFDKDLQSQVATVSLLNGTDLITITPLIQVMYMCTCNPFIVGYNGTAGPVHASVNMGPVQPPQHKGRVPQYFRDKLVELQQKFDELEQCQVLRCPEDIGVTNEYLNPSFLAKKTFWRFSSCYSLHRRGTPQQTSTFIDARCWLYSLHHCPMEEHNKV